MTRVVILTGSELRHQYFRIKVAFDPEVEVLRSYCESEENLLNKGTTQHSITQRERHLLSREQSERDFFETFTNTASDTSNAIVIRRGEINNDQYSQEIIALQPDLILVYGSSILKEPLLSVFPKRILNVHLGLSPYYRGAGTNFWPLVEGYPACVGATFMYIDAGIDTGEIIHQVRATYNFFDTPSTIGNRLIKDMTDVFIKIVRSFNNLQLPELPNYGDFNRYCKKQDFSEESVIKLYSNFKNGIIEDYLENQVAQDSRFPIILNKGILFS